MLPVTPRMMVLLARPMALPGALPLGQRYYSDDPLLLLDDLCYATRNQANDLEHLVAFSVSMDVHSPWVIALKDLELGVRIPAPYDGTKFIDQILNLFVCEASLGHSILSSIR